MIILNYPLLNNLIINPYDFDENYYGHCVD